MTPAQQDLRERAGKLVAHVRDSVEHRPGERSALRRALGRHPDDTEIRPAARRVISPHLHDLHGPQREAVERAFYAVAALIAAQPRRARDEDIEPTPPGDDDHPPQPEAPATADDSGEADHAPGPQPSTGAVALDLGSALGNSSVEAAKARSPQSSGDRDEQQEAPQEKRLHLLCRQDLDGLHRHLPRIVRFLRSERVAVDWTRLACDLATWREGGTNGRNRVAKQWLDGYYRVLSIEETRKRRTKQADDTPTGDDA
ncbi:type I-E CRISPR-associated protein Cse2/CasB [Streptomonospora salina]|uniref:CRISPR system Cascade subunit CasB n=1 Tax=Streptomonospora salina TaxID=104205 RepID=A0A841EAM8_9ACTN|nr:type I-E CRISPR-associated protein Cse2/CasB [Streptomonospora salina]MBB6000056.1 CRISPR system Cascade subunit CasB [Streptomonospora salina]